jgi:hypothetical protein
MRPPCRPSLFDRGRRSTGGGGARRSETVDGAVLRSTPAVLDDAQHKPPAYNLP